MDEAVSFIASTARVMTGFFRRGLERLRDLLLERLAEALREAAPLRAAEERLTVAFALLTRRATERFLGAVERFLLVPPVRRFAEAFPPRFADDFLLPPLRFADDFLLPPLRFADDFLLPALVPDRFFFVAMCSPFDVRWGAVALIEKSTDGNSVARSM